MTPYDPQLPLMRNKLASALEDMFKKAGFTLDPKTQKERIFSRRITDDVVILVFSTIEGAAVRAYGADAIRVCVVSREPDPQAQQPIQVRGLSKESKVLRTGDIEGIVERTLDRMRSSWVKGKKIPRCRRCQAPLFITKANKRACSRLCWT